MPPDRPTEHAVARLRLARLAASSKPFVARGANTPRCPGCRLPPSHCLCAQRPQVPTRAGVCLLMGDVETLKPSNTGWLIADVVPDTWAFQWSRTQVDPALLALLSDPQWQPFVVFPPEYADPGRAVMTEVASAAPADGRRPLFVLLDGTWSEARKMFRKSPYLDPHPVLGLRPEHTSRYRLRRSTQEHHFCTAEVAAMCLAQAGDTRGADTLDAWFDVFSERYISLRSQQALDPVSPAHQRLHALLQWPD
ncbi:MAG: tRNA-uridine aminocarboxypropyltransferase [Hydrogenophaga sp.]